MAKNRYTIRLYRMHDLDLITFIETHEFNLVKAIYSSLTAFAKGEVFVIEVPPRRIKKLPKLSRSYSKALILDDQKDVEAIELLGKIAPGYRNSFLKHLLRLYLCCPFSEEFFRVVKRAKDSDEIIFETPQSEVDEKTEYFMNLFDIFREGKKTVKAGKLRMRTNISEKKEDDFNKNMPPVQKESHDDIKPEIQEESVNKQESGTQYIDNNNELTENETDEITKMFNDLI